MSKLINKRVRYSITFLILLLNGMIYGLGHELYQAQKSQNIDSPQSAGNIPPHPNMVDEIQFGNSTPLPNQGYLSSSEYNIFWFIQISDTQMAWMEWGVEERRDENDGRQRAIRTFFNTTQKIIAPVFIINTGDLVDSKYDNYFIRSIGQIPDEWVYYNETISLPEMGLNSTFYFDMIGNHDIYRSFGYPHFMNYSMTGSAFHTDQIMLNLNFSWGNYQFYLLSTPEDNGLEFPFGLGGYMSTDELDWFESKLQTYASTSNGSFAFGHHPMMEIYSQKSTATGQRLLPMMQKNGIDMYLYGHGHINDFQEYNDLAAFQIAKVDEGKGNYRIVAVDNDRISTEAQIATEWPAGIITAPTDIKLARGNHDMQLHAQISKIRTLAWDPSGIASVRWRADKSETWLPMTNVEGPLYQGNFDSSLVDGLQHIIEVNITNVNGTSVIKSITYCSEKIDFKGWYDFWYLFAIGLVGVITVPICLTKSLRKSNPEKWQKTPNKIVNKQAAKYLLIKLIGALVLPMAFGFMQADSITVVFSFFLIGKGGILYSDTTMMFGGAILAFTLFQSFGLSRKFRPVFFIFTTLAIILDIFFIQYYIVHYPAIGWLAPGYYVALAMDVKAWRSMKALK